MSPAGRILRLYICCQVYSLLTERSKHSTQTAVLKVITDVLRATDQGQVSLLCMLGHTAAFDIVDHDILIHHLQQSFGVKGQALSWIESCLRDTTQSVSIDGVQSTRSFLTCGAPQGKFARTCALPDLLC